MLSRKSFIKVCMCPFNNTLDIELKKSKTKSLAPLMIYATIEIIIRGLDVTTSMGKYTYYDMNKILKYTVKDQLYQLGSYFLK